LERKGLNIPTPCLGSSVPNVNLPLIRGGKWREDEKVRNSEFRLKRLKPFKKGLFFLKRLRIIII
jgi:hypothetical protein